MPPNPYQPPTAIVLDQSAATAEDVALREAHLRHERQIRSIGSLYVCAAIMLVSVPIAMALLGPRSAPDGLQLRWLLPFAAPIAAALFVLGLGFRRLQPWVRIPGGLISAVGLVLFPFGTVIHAWILWLMFGPSGRVVLSPSYQAVIAATPNAKPKLHLADRIATVIGLALLLALLVLVAWARWS